jgi:uncharacterized repeat protein (TIGR03803 family)
VACGPDGGFPTGGLIRDAAGNLYGTTQLGGNTSSSCQFPGGCGVVFKLDPSGKETVLYTFTGGADGSLADAGLVRDSAGNLYGTTQFGGNTSAANCVFYGCGVVFKVDPSGNETVLYTFTGGADGLSPYAGLVRDSAGNLYGTTGYGGTTSSSCVVNGSLGCGVAFKVDPSGNETVLHAFTGGADGGFPLAGLVRAAVPGNGSDLGASTEFFGQTGFGGPNGGNGAGVVFKLDAAGNETVLHSFTGGTDGANPVYGYLLQSKGSLYGTASGGGAQGAGVVFQLQLGNN